MLSRFYACPVCSPTRIGTMTGKWPNRLGLMKAVIPPWRDRGIEPEILTLPEILAENGYSRRAVFGKWHMGHSQKKYLPLSQGFTHFYGHLNGAIDYFTHEREGENDWHRNEQSIHEKGYSTNLLAEETSRYIAESVTLKEPFFIYLPLNAPHSPFQAPEEEIAEIDGLKGVKRTYAAMIKSMDKGIGRILDKLDELKISDNTFILFYSDNGGVNKVSFPNHLKGGKFTVYEGGTRVVAAAKWPKGGISGGQKIDSNPIGYIDVLPTVCAVAGIDISKYSSVHHFDGENVLDAMRGKAKGPERPWFSYIHQNPAQEFYSVIQGSYKLVLKASQGKAAPKIELYNLNDLPLESKNIAGQYPEVTQKLMTQIETFKKSQQNPLPFYGTGRKGFKAPKDWVIEE